jgi:hypothetical protein
MMADTGTVVITVGAGMLINSAYDLQTGTGSASVTLLAGGAVMGILIIIGSASNQWEIVEAIAVLYLVASVFAHATKIKGLDTIFNGASSASTSVKAGSTIGGTNLNPSYQNGTHSA